MLKPVGKLAIAITFSIYTMSTQSAEAQSIKHCPCIKLQGAEGQGGPYYLLEQVHTWGCSTSNEIYQTEKACSDAAQNTNCQ